MGAHFAYQYHAPAMYECYADDGLDVRFCNRMADNINNYNAYVHKFRIIGQPCPYDPVHYPWWSHEATAQERVIGILAPRHVPRGYDQVCWTIGSSLTAGSTGNTTWRLYSSAMRYVGDAAFDIARLNIEGNWPYSVSTITTQSETHDIPGVNRNATVVRGTYGLSYFLLTAQNDNTATRAYLTSFDVWASIDQS